MGLQVRWSLEEATDQYLVAVAHEHQGGSTARVTNAHAILGMLMTKTFLGLHGWVSILAE